MLRLACNKNNEIEKPAHVLDFADNKDTQINMRIALYDMDLCCLLK